MNDEPTVPGRQIVRAPPIGTIASRPMPDVSDLSAGGRYGDVLVNGLIRAQLGLTLGFLALTAALIGTLPRADHLTLGGLPLPLLVLGAGIYPVLVSLGFLYVHLAERLERRFAELLERRS
jgi:hypothetical protein